MIPATSYSMFYFVLVLNYLVLHKLCYMDLDIILSLHVWHMKLVSRNI